MNNFGDKNTSSNHALFSALRSKLAREVCGSAMLADLLEKVNGMEESQNRPAEFKGKFDEFVGRAEEYSTAIRQASYRTGGQRQLPGNGLGFNPKYYPQDFETSATWA